jgi:integrase
MNLLKTVLETARRDWGWIEVNPMADVKRPPPSPNRTRTITDAEVQAIVAWSEWIEGKRPKSQMQRMAIALLIALETGMRANEIGKAVVTGRVARLEKTKNGDPRDVPLSKRAVELYALYEPITESAIDTSFRHCRDSVGLSGFTFHDSRHTACTRLAKKLTPMELARMLGHRDLKSTMIYYNPTAESLADRLG